MSIFLTRPQSIGLASNPLACATADAFAVSPGHTLVIPRGVVRHVIPDEGNCLALASATKRPWPSGDDGRWTFKPDLELAAARSIDRRLSDNTLLWREQGQLVPLQAARILAALG
jgi:hypothetical protein